jgi:predicted ATP-grasp superfamily ATP-dependent carboligase
LYSPSGETLTRVLDKVRLHEACATVGVDAPRTWLPTDEAEVGRLASEAESLVIKPRTQTFFARHAKGELVRGRSELLKTWREYCGAEYARDFASHVPGLELPMVQEYVSGAQEGVCSVTGFVDRRGTLLASLGSLKVLQHPKRVGIGVCFEAVEPPPGLGDKVAALCRHLGYFGVFEAEFIREGERWLLVDFNPRYFGQMGFDIARGVPLPWLCHLAALGAEDEAAKAVRLLPEAERPRVYRDRVALLFRLGTAGAVGGMSPDDARRWRSWLRDPGVVAADASFEPSDPLPAVASAMSMMWQSARHPRAFLRSLRVES